jgi:hypothetical protein
MHLEQLQNTTANGNVSEFFNLFMIPGTSKFIKSFYLYVNANITSPNIGGGHCGPASSFPSAPSTYHTDDVLRDWVENNTFPGSILTSRPLDGSNRTRKICPWPQSARLKSPSAGSDNAESFVCA